MKKFKIYTFMMFMLSVSLNSCNEATINLEPIGGTEASFFQNEDQMTQAVFGIYQKVAFFYAFRGGQFNNMAPVGLLPSDDLTTSAAFAEENFSALNGSNAQLSLYYQFAYQLIARANTVLQKIDENGAIAYQKIPAQKDLNKGEALFLRAYMNFCLWNVYGTAPVVAQRITALENALPPNSKGTELLDQAIADLQQAALLLPASWPANYKGRVTKNSALGLRSKCLVFRGTVNKTAVDFTAAIADINSIVGASLMPIYSNNFDVKFENNAESLYEYQSNTSAGGGANAFVGGAGGNDTFAAIGEIDSYWGIFNQLPSWIGNAYYTATTSIKSAYEIGDPRLSYNINTTSGVLINVKKYITNTAYVNGNASNGMSTNNPRILRYADVLLLKAEAIVRSGGSLQDAITLVNQIRARTRNSDASGSPSLVPADRNVNETNTTTVLGWVFQERRLELAFEEGHRWWDLRRRHIAGEIDLKTLDFQSLLTDFKFQDFNVNFPLPSGEISLSPNLKQNTGY